jgi:hypothetical protein
MVLIKWTNWFLFCFIIPCELFREWPFFDAHDFLLDALRNVAMTAGDVPTPPFMVIPRLCYDWVSEGVGEGEAPVMCKHAHACLQAPTHTYFHARK